MPVRRQRDPVVVPRHSYAGGVSVRHDYGIDDSISRADYLSSAVLEDTFDAASRSRGRDQELMRTVNNAIVSTEQHVSPKAAAVARRVRASTLPPTLRTAAPAAQVQSKIIQARQVEEQRPAAARPFVVLMANNPPSYSVNTYPAPKPVVYVEQEAPWYVRGRAVSVAPVDRRARCASVPPPQARRAPPSRLPPEPLPSSSLWAHRPMPLRSDAVLRARAASMEPARRASMYEDMSKARAASFIPTSHMWAHRPMPLRKDAVVMARARVNARSPYGGYSLRRAASEPRYLERPSNYYPRVPDVKEKALNSYLYAHRGRFGPDSKPPRPTLGEFPKVYVPWHGIGPSNRSKESVFHSPSSGALHASRPPLPKPTERKMIRTDDGFTKPKNLMSWQYRVESRISPDDLIYEPASLLRMRDQVHDIQYKMDRHRQLLDRYLDSEFKPANLSTIPEGGSSAGGDPDNRPVSDLRRRLRRTIAKAKNNPDYYRE